MLKNVKRFLVGYLWLVGIFQILPFFPITLHAYVRIVQPYSLDLYSLSCCLALALFDNYGVIWLGVFVIVCFLYGFSLLKITKGKSKYCVIPMLLLLIDGVLCITGNWEFAINMVLCIAWKVLGIGACVLVLLFERKEELLPMHTVFKSKENVFFE